MRLGSVWAENPEETVAGCIRSRHLEEEKNRLISILHTST